jgi:hypothetical protein
MSTSRPVGNIGARIILGLSDIARKVNETSTAQSFYLPDFYCLIQALLVIGDESLDPLQSSKGLLSLRIVL